MKNEVAIIMGSESDLEIMSQASNQLTSFGVQHKITILSAHRTPERMYQFAKKAEKEGIKVIIAGAGGSAHLPGMVAAMTVIPVIGVPIKTQTLNGLDSLLSIVQMPPGVPVATVAINGSKNAAILAVKILAISSKVLYKKVDSFSKIQRNSVTLKAEQLEKIGFKKYLHALKKDQ